MTTQDGKAGIPAEASKMLGLGMCLHPVKPKGKEAILQGWPKKATNNREQLERWAKQFLDCNWAIATGPKSGTFVVDVDGEEGAETLECWMQEHGSLWAHTLTVSTGKGRHLYFGFPVGAGIRNSAKTVAPGIDIRADGGYVVAPGSTHPSGSVYEIVEDLPLAEPEEWLLDLVLNPPLKVQAPRAETALVTVSQVSEVTIPEGGRNSYLISHAGVMRHKNISPAAIRAALLEENATKCNPPLSEREVIAIAESVCRYQPDHTPPKTHIGLKDLFINEFGEDVRIIEGSEWRVWETIDEGGRWKLDATREIEDRIQRFLAVQASFDPKNARGLASAQMVRNLFGLIRADQRIALTRDRFDANPMVLNTPSGLVDFEAKKIRPVTREDLCSKITAVGVEKMPISLWESYLNRFHPDRERQRFLQRWAGYSLTGDVREQALVFGYGPAKNGKSTFINAISWVMGDYATTASMDTFISEDHHSRHPADLAALAGARLVVSSETQEGRWWDEVKLKQCTGSDRISARFMRENFFTFLPEFKLFFVGNHRPRIRTVDDAIRRRFLIVPFDVTLSEEQRIRGFEEQLKLEGPGILRWMIAGTFAWLHGEFETRAGSKVQSRPPGLLVPDSILQASRQYMDAEDTPGQWLEDCAEKAPIEWTRFSALYQSYKDWAEENGMGEWSGKRFSNWLSEQAGFRAEKRNSGIRGFKGIRLRPNAPI